MNVTLSHVVRAADLYYILGDVDGVQCWATYSANAFGAGTPAADIQAAFATALAALKPPAPADARALTGIIELTPEGKLPTPPLVAAPANDLGL